MHIVLLLAANLDEIVVKKAKDYGPDITMLKRTMEILKNRNYVSVVENGVRGFVVV